MKPLRLPGGPATPAPRMDADRSMPAARPDYRGLAWLVLSAAVGLALVLVATALFIQMV